MITLIPIKRTDERITSLMSVHYSHPKGFVGRNICYAIMFDGCCFGAIAGGSATRFLPGRTIPDGASLNNGVNNIFFHVHRVLGVNSLEEDYPFRNFTTRVLAEYRRMIEVDWLKKYGDRAVWHETLVELPRTGECYRRDGWAVVGKTIGYTCKRTSGKGTDSWSGKRVWDTKNLRPKLVFTRRIP